jgi:hypothetical protein
MQMEVASLQQKMDVIKHLDDARKRGLTLRQMVVTGESIEDATEALVYSRDVISRQILEPHAEYFSNTSKALLQCRVNSWTRAQACTFFINLHKAIWLDIEDIQYNLG